MRIVISGATGLIGRALTEALLGRGDDVVTLARPGSRTLPGTTVSWDPSTQTINMAGLADVGAIDAVIHLAGAGIADKRWTAGRKAEIRESRIAGTSTLATAAANLESTPSVFISGSAIGWYGSRGDETLDEGSSRGDGFLADVCVDWEDASAPAKAAGIRTVLARTGIVLSPKGGALAKQLPLFRLGIGGRLGPGTQWTSWISLADEVRALLFLLDDAHVSGPVNLTSPEPVRNEELTRALGRALHRPAVLPVPGAALKVVLGSELVNEALLASQRVLPGALQSRGFEFDHPSIDAALSSML